MTKEAIFSGLALIRKEMNLMQQNLALKDSSSVAFRLRNVVDHVVVGDHTCPVVKGLSCDIPINIPHKIFDAVSDAAKWRAAEQWFDKVAEELEGENGQYKLVAQVREAIDGLKELATRGFGELDLHKTVKDVSAPHLKKLEGAIANCKAFIGKIAKEVDEEIERSKVEAAKIEKSINEDRGRLCNLSTTELALNLSSHFEKLLELASYGAVTLTPNKEELYRGVYLLAPSSEDLSSEDLDAFSKAGVSHAFSEAGYVRVKMSGRIAGLRHFSAKLKELKNATDKWIDDPTGVVRPQPLGENVLSTKHLIHEVAAYEVIEKYFGNFMDCAAEAKLESQKAEEAVELAKKERYESLALSEAEFNARMEALGEQKTLLMRVLAFLIEFNKQISRINIS